MKDKCSAIWGNPIVILKMQFHKSYPRVRNNLVILQQVLSR